MAAPSILVRPGPPDTPQFVDIDCSEMKLSKVVEFLVNGVVRATVPVKSTRRAVFTYVVPPGRVRNALADLHMCSGQIDKEGSVLCGCSNGLGDSMQLRYKV